MNLQIEPIFRHSDGDCCLSITSQFDKTAVAHSNPTVPWQDTKQNTETCLSPTRDDNRSAVHRTPRVVFKIEPSFT